MTLKFVNDVNILTHRWCECIYQMYFKASRLTFIRKNFPDYKHYVLSIQAERSDE